MIYTLTLSPSIDYYVKVKNLKLGEINRTNNEFIKIGGKGINVSFILKELNIPSTQVICTAGFTGDEIKQQLNNHNLNYIDIKVDGYNRINVKVLSQEETAINGNSLILNINHIENIIEKLNQLDENDMLVISGSVPSSLNLNAYEYILNKINTKKIKVIVDTEKELQSTLKYHPYLIKPNLDELEKAVNKKLETIDDIYCAACSLIEQGAKNALVSLGDKGLIYVNSNLEYIYKEAKETTVVDTTGAGDSLLAGFIGGLELGYDINKSLDLGLACATATVGNVGLGNIEQINKLLKK